MIDPEVRRELDALRQGFIVTAGTLTLQTSGTTTTITRQGVSTSSHVSLTPYTSAAKTEGIPQCVPANGSFTLTHSASGASRIYTYAVHTPIVR